MTTRLNARSAFAVMAATVVLIAGAVRLNAQAGPPLAKVSSDTQPTLRLLVPPSPPPSTVAPRASTSRRAAVVAPADSGPRPLKRMSLPVDSVRPAPVPVNALDPKRAPVKQPAPPAPGSNAAAQQVVAPRAALISNEPPANATARCKDGTFVTLAVDANTCADRGGIAVRLGLQRQAPRRPNP